MMNEMKLFETLKEAYETSTPNCNRFLNEINTVAWDQTFTEDGETYFVKDGFTLTVENVNPFEENWKPMAFFSDKSVVEF